MLGPSNTCFCSVTELCLTHCDPMDCSCQAPLSMGFSRQGYWSGLPCPPPGDLPDPGIKPVSLKVSCMGRWALYHWRHLGSPVFMVKSPFKIKNIYACNTFLFLFKPSGELWDALCLPSTIANKSWESSHSVI